MAEVTTTTDEASYRALPSAAKTLYAADIYALQYRLRRCLEAVTPLVPPLSSCTDVFSSSPPATSVAGSDAIVARHVRRLGELLREATQLNARVFASHGYTNPAAEAAEEALPSTTPHHNDEDATEEVPLRAYYDQQLQARFSQMQHDMVTAERLLRACLASAPGLRGLPMNCVGTSPCLLTLNAAMGPPQVCYVYTDALTPTAAQLPEPTLHHIASAANSAEAAGTRPTAPPPALPPVKEASITGAQGTEVKAEALATTAEDQLMEDIQQAIHQMKDGALQMSAMMAQERAQMKSATELLSGGVAKTRANMKDLDRVSYVAASSQVPHILSFIPGMPILWRTVLQPLWAMLKQVLLMASILAITGCVLVLISVVPKPVRFRAQHKPTLATHSSQPGWTAVTPRRHPQCSSPAAANDSFHTSPSPIAIASTTEAEPHAPLQLDQEVADEGGSNLVKEAQIPSELQKSYHGEEEGAVGDEAAAPAAFYNADGDL